MHSGVLPLGSHAHVRCPSRAPRHARMRKACAYPCRVYRISHGSTLSAPPHAATHAPASRLMRRMHIRIAASPIAHAHHARACTAHSATSSGSGHAPIHLKSYYQGLVKSSDHVVNSYWLVRKCEYARLRHPPTQPRSALASSGDSWLIIGAYEHMHPSCWLAFSYPKQALVILARRP